MLSVRRTIANVAGRVRKVPRPTLLAVTGACALGAVVLFSFVGYNLLESGSTGFSADPETVARAWRYALDPGGVYDRVATRGPANQPYNYSISVPVENRAGPFGSGSFRILISRIDVDAPVKAYGMNSDLVPEVPLMAQEVAWYNFSAPPGVGSNAVFAGHVNWSGDAVFHDLNRVKPGDRIQLKDAVGVYLEYTVTESRQVSARDKEIVQLMGPTSDDIITLITCDGDYRYTGDPILRGEYNKRRVVRAILTTLVAPTGHPLTRVQS